jgi:hypothetical protein
MGRPPVHRGTTTPTRLRVGEIVDRFAERKQCAMLQDDDESALRGALRRRQGTAITDRTMLAGRRAGTARGMVKVLASFGGGRCRRTGYYVEECGSAPDSDRRNNENVPVADVPLIRRDHLAHSRRRTVPREPEGPVRPRGCTNGRGTPIEAVLRPLPQCVRVPTVRSLVLFYMRAIGTCLIFTASAGIARPQRSPLALGGRASRTSRT